MGISSLRVMLLKVKSPSVDAEWPTNSTGVADVYEASGIVTMDGA